MRGGRGMTGVRRARAALLITMAVSAALSLSGCAALLLIPPPGAAAGTGTNTGTDAGTGPSGGTVTPYSDGSVSERGNVTKRLDQPAGETNLDRTQRLDTFVVTRILIDPPCLNDAAPPENGHYLEVDLRVTTTDALGTDGSNSTIDFSPDNWYYYPGGGNGGVGASVETDDCQVATPALSPLVLGPSTTATGSIILDVNDDSEWIAYAPYSNGPGWEWGYTPATG